MQKVAKLGIINQAVPGFKGNRFRIIARYKPDVVCPGYDQPIKKKELAKKIRELGLRPKFIG